MLKFTIQYKLFGDVRKNLKKHEYHCQVQGFLVGQLRMQEGFLFASKFVHSEMSSERFSISLPSAIVTIRRPELLALSS